MMSSRLRLAMASPSPRVCAAAGTHRSYYTVQTSLRVASSPPWPSISVAGMQQRPIHVVKVQGSEQRSVTEHSGHQEEHQSGFDESGQEIYFDTDDIFDRSHVFEDLDRAMQHASFSMIKAWEPSHDTRDPKSISLRNYQFLKDMDEIANMFDFSHGGSLTEALCRLRGRDCMELDRQSFDADSQIIFDADKDFEV